MIKLPDEKPDALFEFCDRIYDDRARAGQVASDLWDLCLAEVQRLNATAQPVSDAAIDVLSERERQVYQEGWTPEHDDTHSSGEMAGAAACYARHVMARQWVYPWKPDDYTSEEAPGSWPWDEKWWKPKSPREDLVRAAALIIAEIERLDRVSENGEKDEL